MVVVHHRGRQSGREYVTPMMYLPHDTAPDSIYVFATKGGVPTNPDWYYNLIANPDITIEKGSESIAVRATEVLGAERDAIFARQAARFAIFAEYQRKLSRVIPVIRLERRES